ncbi:MAG: site-specific integrase [Betaproteobacteria bacterium]|nr:site-specific integrase [Betaproteobacteria bacterium]
MIELKNGRWRVQVRRKGYPTYDRCFASAGEARAAEAKVVADQSALRQQSADVTLAEAWQRYAESYEFSLKSEETRKTERGRIKPVMAALGGYSLAVLQESPDLVSDYIDRRSRTISKRTGKKLSATSLRLEIAALAAVAIWGVKRRLLRKNFTLDVQRPGKGEKRKRRVPPLELGLLERMTTFVDRPRLAEAARFVLLLRFLGCRPGELAGLQRADIRFLERDVTFRGTKHRREDRLVHMTQRAANLIDGQYSAGLRSAPDSRYLFSTRRRHRDDQGRIVWEKYRYAPGVLRLREEGVVGPTFHAHAMRREYISRAIEAGLPYATIRKQTGHHSTQAIEIYDEGLSTAPDVREQIDAHESALDRELLLGWIEAMGPDHPVIKEVLASLRALDDPGKWAQIQRANGEMVPMGPGKRRK